MRKLLSIILTIFTLLFMNSCSKERLVGINNNSTNGSVFLKVSNSTIPFEVRVITARLSRLNYDTLQASINATNDSLISFDNVPVGNWHLEADAKNSEGKIIYTGETNVNIIEDQTVDIYLTLSRVGSELGNIRIYIEWDSKWIDYINNPLITKHNVDFDKYGVGACFVFKDDDNYKMWYTGLSNNGMGYGYYAYSNDGLTWEKDGTTPFLFPDTNGGWDSKHVSPGPVINEDGIYKMYYSGWSDQYGNWPVGLATSTDGIHWEKYKNNPVIVGDNWCSSIRPQSIIKLNGKYLLYFTGGTGNNCKIGVATSTDGYNWKIFSGEPILKSEKNWEGYGVASPTVIFDDGLLKMVYWGILPANTSFGIAYSTDGFRWSKDQNNPLFKTDNCNVSYNKISYPFLLKVNNEYRIYYTGIDVNSTDWEICLTRMFQ